MFCLPEKIVEVLKKYDEIISSRCGQEKFDNLHEVEGELDCHELLDSWQFEGSGYWMREGKAGFPLHRTMRREEVKVGEEVKVLDLMVSPEGRLWALVHKGDRGNAPGYYAHVGEMPGAGPLVPLAALTGVVQVKNHPCDCGYGRGSLVEVWGDPREQAEARRALVEALR